MGMSGIIIRLQTFGVFQSVVKNGYKSIVSNNDTVIQNKKIATDIVPYYPPNDGALGDTERVFLMPGQKVDRFGRDTGKYLAPAGTPMLMRTLPPNNTGKYHIYEVIKPFEVERSTIAPAFGQIGLGTQYKTPVQIKVLVNRGILKEI